MFKIGELNGNYRLCMENMGRFRAPMWWWEEVRINIEGGHGNTTGISVINGGVGRRRASYIWTGLE